MSNCEQRIDTGETIILLKKHHNHVKVPYPECQILCKTVPLNPHCLFQDDTQEQCPIGRNYLAENTTS